MTNNTISLKESTLFIVQYKLNRKNSEWVDYYGLKDIEEALSRCTDFRNHEQFKVGRDWRVICRVITETLVQD